MIICEILRNTYSLNINIYYYFNKINSKNNKGCEKHDESLVTELLDMRDREWQHIGYEEQFKSLRDNFFKQLIQIVLQLHIEMIEGMNFFSWQSSSCSNIRSAFEKKPAR